MKAGIRDVDQFNSLLDQIIRQAPEVKGIGARDPDNPDDSDASDDSNNPKDDGEDSHDDKRRMTGINNHNNDNSRIDGNIFRNIALENSNHNDIYGNTMIINSNAQLPSIDAMFGTYEE